MISKSRRSKTAISPWPGYVDVLSALLMVVIFVLLIFTFAHFILNEIMTDQESELASLHRRLEEITVLLGLEQEKNQALSAEMADLTGLVQSLSGEKAALDETVEALSHQSRMDRAQIETQLLTMASLQEDINALQRLRHELEARVGKLSASLSDKDARIGALRDRAKALETRLADQQERTLLAQKTIEEKNIRIQALAALVGDQKEALKREKQLSASARAEMTLLNRQVAALKSRLEEISRALRLAENQNKDQKAEIKDLGKRLNIALARRVNTLEKYRSEFFGRLREVLGDNPFIRIEGDRFVFQAELLFASGSADIGAEGHRHLSKLARVLAELSEKMPEDIRWILRIDGHTDRIPIHNAQFASNWELSTARALSVVRFLAAQGIPEQRMAATGFSKYHPLDPADSPEAYRKNRRIEIKLTSR